MAKSNFIVRGGADFSKLYHEFNTAQKKMKAFQAGISKAVKRIGAVIGTVAAGKLVKDSTQMAMGVESAVDNVNRNMRSSAGAFQEWVNTQSQALGMAKSDAYSYGSTFSNLLSSFTSSAQETAEQTQELMKAAAIIASKTGRTYEDTANRIRSGMLGSTEAIEDLGVYTNISMIESTEAFRRLAGDKSWSQLSFQTQQQIRLAAILEQTYARYGDTLADTTQTRQAQFIASLKNIQLSLGQAFLPIYNAVLPALTRMAEAIGRVINLVAQFVTALFGAPKQTQAQADATQAQADATGDLGDSITGAGKAAKKASKALAGFDEINKLSSKTDAGKAGAGAAGAGTVSMPPLDTGGFIGATTEVSEKMQKMADKVKEGFERIKNTIMENKPLIIAGLAGIGAGIATYLIGTNWTTIVTTVKGAMSAVGGAISGVSAPILLIAALIALLVAAIVDLWQNNEEFRKKVTNAWNGIKDTMSKVWDTVLKPIWKALKEAAIEVWNNGLKPLWNKWVNFVKNIVYFMSDMWKQIKPGIDWFIATFGPTIADAFKRVIRAVKDAVLQITTFMGDLLDGMGDVLNGIKQMFGGIIDFIAGVFTGDWKRAWEGVKKIFSGICDAFKGIIKAPLNYIIDGVNKFIRGVNKIKIDVPDWIAKLAGVKGGRIGFNIPTIPRLAQGGIITSPTIAMVGEAGAEAVMPLERNTGWIDILAGKLASAMQGVQLAGAGGDIYVYVGNEQVDAYIHRSQDRRNIRSNGR